MLNIVLQIYHRSSRFFEPVDFLWSKVGVTRTFPECRPTGSDQPESVFSPKFHPPPHPKGKRAPLTSGENCSLPTAHSIPVAPLIIEPPPAEMLHKHPLKEVRNTIYIRMMMFLIFNVKLTSLMWWKSSNLQFTAPINQLDPFSHISSLCGAPSQDWVMQCSIPAPSFTWNQLHEVLDEWERTLKHDQLLHLHKSKDGRDKWCCFQYLFWVQTLCCCWVNGFKSCRLNTSENLKRFWKYETKVELESVW